MATIHEQIDELLAADLHGELGAAERDALHGHLVECADCRRAFQEQKNMHKLLNETLADEKADPAFEQRMVSRFRDRVPQRSAFVNMISNLLRVRAVQLTAVAALLLALAQMGKMITGESARPLARGEYAGAMPGSGLARAKSDADGRSFAASARPRSAPSSGVVAQEAPPPPPPPQDKANQPGEGLRQLPSFVGSTKTKKAESKDEENRPTSETESALPVTVYGADVESRQGATAVPEGPSPAANRKLVRNATAELEVISFEEAIQKITGFAAEDKGYVATSSSQKQANSKLSGEVVVKVLPEHLDRFLQKLRGIGELKNQALTTEDVTKAYFDTEARLKNARLMEQRLMEILKTKSKDVADLLKVEKELGRVREEIEKMQGELKFMDSQVQFATVTIQLSEKNMNLPAAFLLKERARLALYAGEVEKTYNEVKALASPKVQITNAQINRDNAGRVSATMNLLIAPEESEAIIARVKSMARVENFQVQTDRIAQGGGEGISESAKTERDKVELAVTISREEQEQALQQTTLRIRTAEVTDRTKELRDLADKQGGRIRSSSFSRDPNGREFANVSLRVPMKNYSALMQSLNGLGKVENVSVQREDRIGSQINEADAPADITIQVYSQGNIVSEETGIIATLRRTIGQGAAALMSSVRMIGVALAFLAPWVLAIVGVSWVMRRIKRARMARKQRAEEEGGAS